MVCCQIPLLFRFLPSRDVSTASVVLPEVQVISLINQKPCKAKFTSELIRSQESCNKHFLQVLPTLCISNPTQALPGPSQTLYPTRGLSLPTIQPTANLLSERDKPGCNPLLSPVPSRAKSIGSSRRSTERARFCTISLLWARSAWRVKRICRQAQNFVKKPGHQRYGLWELHINTAWGDDEPWQSQRRAAVREAVETPLDPNSFLRYIRYKSGRLRTRTIRSSLPHQHV